MQIADLQKMLTIIIGIFLAAIFVSSLQIAFMGGFSHFGKTPHGALYFLGVALLFVALFRNLYILEMNLAQYRMTLWIALAGLALPILALAVPTVLGP